MKRAAWWPWCIVAVWATWSFALTALAADALGLGRAAPQLGWVLLAALAVKLDVHSLPTLAFVFALARAASSVDDAAAGATACLGFVAFVRLLRGAFDVSRPALLAVIVLVSHFALAAWFALAHDARLSAESTGALLSTARESWLSRAWSQWPSALTSAAAVFALAPLARRLPGVPALVRKPAWPAAASYR